MTQLVEALDALHLEGDLSHADRWVKLQGQRCWVYVAAAKGGGYFTWCDDPQERAIAFYRDPIEGCSPYSWWINRISLSNAINRNPGWNVGLAHKRSFFAPLPLLG